MAITTQMRTDVANLYVSLFGRAPERDGLGFWVNQMDAGQTIAQVAQSMFETAPARNTYPTFLTNEEIVGRFYSNVLGRTADAEGLAFWTNKLNAGASKGALIAEMISAVQSYAGTDAAALASKNLLANKVAVSLWYAVDQGGNDVNAASAILSTVTAAQASVDAIKAGTNTGTAGQTFALTTGSDSIVGTGNNDTVTASVVFAADETATAASTLTAADSINGGAGTDTVNLVISGAQDAAVAIPAASISGVEVLNVRNTVAQTASLDASTVSGLTAFNADRSTGKVAVTNLAVGASVGVIGDGTAATGAVDFSYATATTPLTINVVGGTKSGAVITNTGVAPTTATINSSGAANTTGIIDLGTGTAVTSLTVNAATNLTSVLAADYAATAALTVKGAAASVDLGTVGNFKTIDASGLTAGGLTIAVGSNTTSFKGGAGNDVVTTAAIGTTTASAIDAGTGSADKLVVGATTDVDTAAEAKLYAGFDVLQVGTGVTADASLFTNSAITSIVTSGTATINNLTATQAAAVQVTGDAATTLGVKDATTVGNLDTVNLTAKFATATAEAADADHILTLTAPSAAGVEKINLNVDLNAATTDFAVSAMTGTLALTSLTLTGTAKTFSITSGVAAQNVNTVIDASAVATKATIDYSGATANGVSIKGGSAGDVLTGSALADVIAGNAGDDVITGGDGADVITGGAGMDNIVVSATAAVGVDTLKFAATDSVSSATGALTFVAVGTVPTGATNDLISSVAGAASGTAFIIDTGLLATGSTVTFGAAVAPTMGTTAVSAAGAWYVNVLSATDANVYQDTNGNAKIDAGEFAVHLVGTGISASDFSIVAGQLNFIGAA